MQRERERERQRQRDAASWRSPYTLNLHAQQSKIDTSKAEDTQAYVQRVQF